MTPATATVPLVGRLLPDRLSRGWREGSAPSGEPGESALRPRPAGCSARSDGGRLTLEQRLDSVWEGLHAGGAAECPVCHGHMEGFGPARCGDCGGELL